MKKNVGLWFGLLFGLTSGILGNLFVSSIYENDLNVFFFSALIIIISFIFLFTLMIYDLPSKNNLSKSKKDLHLRIFQSLFENPGMTLLEIKKELNLSDNEINAIFQQHKLSGGNGLFVNISNEQGNVNFNDKLILNAESTFRYLEYKELILATQSSIEARKFSIIAIILSVMTIILSIVLSFLTQNVKIV